MGMKESLQIKEQLTEKASSLGFKVIYDALLLRNLLSDLVAKRRFCFGETLAKFFNRIGISLSFCASLLANF
jgi:hypothetical protein